MFEWAAPAKHPHVPAKVELHAEPALSASAAALAMMLKSTEAAAASATPSGPAPRKSTSLARGLGLSEVSKALGGEGRIAEVEGP